MVRWSLSLALVLSVWVPHAVGAQAPDFSGTWVLSSSRSARGAGAPGDRAAGGMTAGGGGGGSLVGGARAGGGTQPPEITIAQSGGALTIERTAPSPMKWVYKLDGSESVNTNGRTTTRTRSRWEGGTLVTEGTQTVAMEGAEVKGTIREVRSIAADGTLTVETTRTAEGMTSPAPVLTQIYKKKQ